MTDSRTRIWFSLFVLAVFCVGLAGGLVIGRRLTPAAQQRGAGPIFQGRGPGGPRPGMLFERLDRELALTADQRTHVRAIFDERRARLESVQRDLLARADQERRELQAEVRKVLTPEQRERFDRWIEQSPKGRRGRF
jgi:Spy/CpxP family protein refolding chaperone